MSRFSKSMMLVVAMSLVLVMVFAGCASTKQDAIAGGDAAAEVTNNGGLVVKQGAYVYYINGLSLVADIKTDKDNAFGNVVKGAIMRGEMDDNGNIVDTKVLVPLMALSGNKNGGINVYGNWVYYTTPSTKKDKDGVMQTNYLEYMRTSINGTKTENIATVDGQSTEYIFTPNALIYLAGGELTRVSYDDKKISKPEVIADKVTSVLMPKNETFKPGTPSMTDVVFYTKPSDDDKATYNVTYAVATAKDSKPQVLIDGKTYTDTDDKKAQYTISLKQYNVVGDGIELYYEKANPNNPENVEGIFAAKYKDGALDAKNEVVLTEKSYATFYPVDMNKGLYVYDNNKLILKKKPADKFASFDVAVTEDLASATILSFIDYTFMVKNAEGVVEAKALPSVLYTAGNKFYVRALDDSLKLNTKVLTDESRYGINSAWLAPEIMDGKVYFFNSSFYSYLECVDIATGKLAANDKGELTHPLAKLNAKDAEAEKQRIEQEKKEEK